MNAQVYCLLEDMYHDNHELVSDALERYVGEFKSTQEFMRNLTVFDSYHFDDNLNKFVTNDEKFIWEHLYFYISGKDCIHVFERE